MIRPALAALAVAAAGCAKETPEAPASTPSIQLYAMNCGEMRIDDVDDYADDGSFAGVARDFADPCYLIRHPKGDLLWDTGIPASIHDAPVDSGIYHLRVPATLEQQLADLAMTPADVEFLSFSHTHFDHVGNAALFTGATWIVDADERAHMFREEARADSDFAAIAPLEALTPVLIEGDGDHDVFGDGSVTIVQAPGHTPGHAVLLVRLKNAGPVILAGDMWHLAESRERRTVPKFNTDRDETLRSMDKVEKLAADNGARIVRQHVPEDFAALPKFPEALE